MQVSIHRSVQRDFHSRGDITAGPLAEAPLLPFSLSHLFLPVFVRSRNQIHRGAKEFNDIRKRKSERKICVEMDNSRHGHTAQCAGRNDASGQEHNSSCGN